MEENMPRTRREFLRDLGLSAAALPFVLNLPSLGFANQAQRKKRLVVMFSPDGVIPWNFWPDEEGDCFTLKESLKPLMPFQDRVLTLHGVCDTLQADLTKVAGKVGAEDKRLLDEHATFVREMEKELREDTREVGHAMPAPEPGLRSDNDSMPKVSKLQIDLMVNSFVNDF